MSHTDAQRRKARTHHSLRSFTPADRPPCFAWQPMGQFPRQLRAALVRTPQQLGRPPLALPRFGWQGFLARRPQTCVRQDADHVAKTSLRQSVPKLRRLSVPRISHYRRQRDFLGQELVDFSQRDRPFFLKLHLRWHSRGPSALTVLVPFLRKIETKPAGYAQDRIDQ